MTVRFSVIDNLTGNPVDWEALPDEKWVKADLIEDDLFGFAIDEWGDLVLLDDCGRWVPCPENRFTVVFDEDDDKEDGGLVE